MRSSKIAARLLSAVLAVMMLFSLVTVGFTASAADVEVAQTGVTMTGGEKLYLVPNDNWNIDNARFAIYVFGTGDAWESMTAVEGETNLYEVTVPTGSWTNVIFCRMNPSSTTNSWDTKWNQTSDLTYDGTNNCYTVKESTWDKGGGTWSTYVAADAVAVPDAPVAATVAVTATSGTGTEADPYLVTPEAAVEMTITGTLGDATGLAYSVDDAATMTDLTAGQTSVMYTGVTAPAVGETLAINVYLWAYNKEGSIQKYSETYATTTIYVEGAESTGSEDTDTYTLPYQAADGLYAYAGTEVAGTNAWQRWDNVNDVRYFYLPASASDTEVVILNTYSATVMINNIAIAAGQYATVPYVAGTTYTCSGATTQSVKIDKTDAEGTIYINSAVDMETEDDNGNVSVITDATYDLYSFITSGTKNQEVCGAAGAVASEADGVQEDTTVKKMKGRGNSTWNLSKKPFNITYKSSVSIDGMSGKKWSLLANAQDSSLLRNRLVYDLANEIGMKYACDSRFVDMFINGDYKGSYQLTQKIEMGSNTVMPDLEEPNTDSADGEVPTENFDFILELDTADNANNAGDQYFTTDRNQVMTHKTPDEPTDEQVAFMAAKYQALEDALYGDDLATLATLVDINDFAKAYLVNEVAKNLDSGVTSCYFVYNSTDGIFYMSPVWDYDNALGNSVNSSARVDASGNVLDLKSPTGWYAKELMHYDSNFTGERSVFSQACYMTSTTADGKSFMDIVKEVWAADFADIADVLTGDAAASGRLQTVDGYLASLAKSGAWNYSQAGWQLSNSTNNSWISDHSKLTMYSYDTEANTVSTSVKNYDQTNFEDQARYAADWMVSRINWMSAQFNEADTSAPEGYVTVYFTNNWNFQDMYVYYWGSSTGSCADWPGDEMVYVETNENGEDIYSANIPADVTGFLFNGLDDQNADNRRQTVDITTVPETNTGYYCSSETDGKITVGTWTYTPGTDEPTTDAPETETTEPTLNEDGTKTIYFSNNKKWTGIIYAYYWYTTATVAEGDTETTEPAYPGTAMTLVDTNEYGEDIYSITIPGDAENIQFNADGNDETKTVDIDATTLSTNTGIYVLDSEPYYGTYAYTPSTEEATEDEVTATPITEEMTVYFTNNWNFQDVYVYYWGTEDVTVPEWPGVAMTFVETNEGGESIYSAVLPVGTTGFLFNGESDTPSTDEEGNEYYARRQTVDIVAADVTLTGFYCDSETDGKITVGTYTYVPYVPDDTAEETESATATETETTTAADSSAATGEAEYITVYFTNSWMWTDVAVYTWGSAVADDSAEWPGKALTYVETNEWSQDIYSAVIPADVAGMLFTGTDNGNDTQSPDIVPKDGYGYYMDWNETDGTFVGEYLYTPYVPATEDETDAPTTDAPTTDAPTTDAPTTDAPVTETETVFLKPSTNWMEAGAWFAVYYWTDSTNGWVTMTETEDEGIYTAELPTDATGVIFVRMSVDATEPGWNSETETNKVWGQTADLTLPTDKTQNMFSMDAGWDATGTWTAYDATPATTDETVQLAGSFTEWGAGALTMTADENGTVYTVSDVRLEAGTYEFKIVKYGEWLGNAGTIDNVCEGWTFASKDADGNDVVNCTLVTKGGLYTFSFDTETNKLTATAVLDVYTYDVTYNEGNFTVDAPETVTEATDLTFTVTPADGYKVSAVIVDMALVEAVDGVYTVANVQADVNILVIVSEVATEPAVMEFTVTFTDKDGNVIDTQTVEYGNAATAPEAPEVDGYNFTGWDTAFDYVTKDITVQATYKKISTPVEPATTGTLKIEVTGGTGFTIAVNDGSARPQGTSYQNTKTPIGATVTVVANGTNTFLGWMNEAGALVSTTDTYTFTTTGDDYLKAVYMSVVEGVNVVTFKNGKAASGNGQILDMQYYAAGEEVTFPDAPTQAGYDFTGWSMTAEEIQTALAAGEDVTVTANWEASKVYIDVIVNGGTI